MNAPLFALAGRARHAFDPDAQIRVPADPALQRGPQVERPCLRCGAVKITWFPLAGTADAAHGGGGRLWRLPGETAQRVEDPGCVSDDAMMAKAAMK